MNLITIADAQADMRRGYLCGAPGILASGIVWAIAAGIATRSVPDAVLALLIGGAAIHPLGVALAKALGHAGAHSRGNPLGNLALEATVWLIAGVAIAYGTYVLRAEWFFPIMLLVIGSRYLTFQTLYGMRIYWVMGALLCIAGLLLGVVRAAPLAAASSGAAIELAFAALVFVLSRRRLTA